MSAGQIVAHVTVYSDGRYRVTSAGRLVLTGECATELAARQVVTNHAADIGCRVIRWRSIAGVAYDRPADGCLVPVYGTSAVMVPMCAHDCECECAA